MEYTKFAGVVGFALSLVSAGVAIFLQATLSQVLATTCIVIGVALMVGLVIDYIVNH